MVVTKKITFISPPPSLSGGIRVIAIYADYLLSKGHDVLVVAGCSKPISAKRKVKALLSGEPIPKEVSSSHYDNMNAPLKIVKDSEVILAKDVPDADIVIATWWETAFMVADFPEEKGKKFYFVQGYEKHDFLPAHISSGSYHLPLRKITVSSWLSDIMSDCYNDSNVSIVPNSVDHSVFNAHARSKQKQPTIGFMYGTTPIKGVDITLKAIEKVKKLFPNLQVIVFSAVPIQKGLTLPQGTKFFLRPKQMHIKDIYAMCDVFVMGSRSEGFGLPILEAMACRSPVVATRTGCAPDLIVDGENGYVVDVEDYRSMAKCICNILRLSDIDWMKMSDTAYKAAASYTWEESGELFEKTILYSV